MVPAVDALAAPLAAFLAGSFLACSFLAGFLEDASFAFCDQ